MGMAARRGPNRAAKMRVVLVSRIREPLLPKKKRGFSTSSLSSSNSLSSPVKGDALQRWLLRYRTTTMFIIIAPKLELFDVIFH